MPHPFSSDVFAKNLSATLDDISTQIAHAQSVKGRARTGYYRMATLLAACCVEATLYEYIVKACQKNPEIVSRVSRFKTSREAKTLIQLPKQTLGTTKELWVCEIDRSRIDRTTNFKDMNDFALETKLIGTQLHHSLETVRKKRNEIHLQTLQNADRHYTNHTLEKMAAVFLKILDKLEKL